MTGYSHTVKGKKYYLHKKGPLFFFSKDVGTISLPSNMTVLINSRTGLPFVKKKNAGR